jgi:hypothetical protein
MAGKHIARVAAAFLAIFAGLPTPAWAWGKEGHQIVGFIAEMNLTPAAQAGIASLLGEDRRISDESISNWADYARNQVHATGAWHYVDIPVEFGKFDAKRDCQSSDCVVARVDRFRELLADKSLRNSDRQEAIKFLIHLVADMHQPLHCAERRNRLGQPDRGGNDCKVRFLDEPTDSNLHKVWDTSLLVHSVGDRSLSDYATSLGSRITAAQRAAWRQGDPRVWANQSHRVAVTHAYAGVAADGPATPLDVTYVAKNQRVVDEQLSRAGIRLAKILNEAFAE